MKSGIIDLMGRRFGYLTVLELGPQATKAPFSAQWKCRCDCGVTLVVGSHLLRAGRKKSCGKCQYRKHKGGRPRTLGYSHPSERNSWHNMLYRCQNPKNISYKNYGGRGITVCERWKEFKNFLEDMGKKPGPGYTLERDDVNGNYERSNCRWTTAKNRRNTVWLIHDGFKITMPDLLRKLGLTPSTVRNRLRNRWTLEAALFTPVDIKREPA